MALTEIAALPNLEFRKLPEWRVDEILHELEEENRVRLGEELTRRILSGENTFYAERPVEGGPGITVGIGSWRIRSWPRADGPKESTGLIELSFMHVRPDERDGITGLAMVNHAIEEASGHFSKAGYQLRKVYALVPSGNPQRINNYLSWGFRQEAVLERHFSNDYDMLVFSRFIS